jgi:hypothetical protein
MVSCFLSTCPQSHRRPRDLVRRHWSHLVTEAMPVWAVLVDDRPAIVAPADDRLVVVCGGLRAVDWTVGFGQITEVSSARSVVYVVDDAGHCYDFTFLDSGDAVRATRLIDQRRTAARGTAEAAGAAGADRDVIDRWEGWRAMEPVGQGDAEQIDVGRGGNPPDPAGEPQRTADADCPDSDRDRAELERAEADAAAVEAERAAGRAAADPPWVAAQGGPAPDAAEGSAAGAEAAPADPEVPEEAVLVAHEEAVVVVPEEAAVVVPEEVAPEVSEEATVAVPEEATVAVSEGIAGGDRMPVDAGGVSVDRARAVGAANGHGGTAVLDAPRSLLDDGPLTGPAVDLPGGSDELPIEREVAMAIARSGGQPVDWWAIPLRGSEPPAPERPQPLAIPTQAPAHASESVLLVTTEGVAGRTVLDVHGDVLAVASWPVPGPSGRSVHEVARDRLAQAVLRRGGNALVGLRYGATGMVGGDVVAYGTAVTLAPVEQGGDEGGERAAAGARPGAGSADR